MSEGAVLELLSRGKKDAYQIQDPVRTWFGSHYDRRSPTTREYRDLFPENLPRFGQSFDIILPSDGDILKAFDLRILMPTWLPPDIVLINRAAPSRVRVLSAPYRVLTPTGYVDMPPAPIVYGWVNGITNYMIHKWALFADTMMIMEGYGEFNSWYPDMDTTHFQAPLIHASTGRHDASDNNIEANATLQELVFRVPLPGLEAAGLPLCAMNQQKIYLRFWLRSLPELVESGLLPQPPGVTAPLYELAPAPWMRPIYVDGVLTGEMTSAARFLKGPIVYARTIVLNVENDLRDALVAQRFQIPFRRQLRDYWEISKNSFSQAPMKHPLLIGGYFQTLFLGIRSIARISQNKYYDLTPSPGGAPEWLAELEFNVNGQDRIYPWGPLALRTLANNTQIGRDITAGLYYLVFGSSPDDEPAGACDLTECQKAAINMRFAPVAADPMTGSNQTSLYVIGLSWNVLDIADGVVSLKFVD